MSSASKLLKMSKQKSTTGLLKQLRALMNNSKVVGESLQAYIVPSVDAHNSEYTAECDKFRAFVSGFDGSAGTAIITNEKGYMWTDGRYYLQALEQMDSNWVLMKEGDPETPKRGPWLIKHLPPGARIGVDPKLITYSDFNSLKKELETAGQKLISVRQNLIEMIWQDRPERTINPLILLTKDFSGKTVKEKLQTVVNTMKQENAAYLVLTALDQIAWLLNLRGSDIEYNPVFFSYVVIGADGRFTLFVDEKQANSPGVIEHLLYEAGDVFEIKLYKEIEETLKNITGALNDHQKVWFSEESSYALISLIPKEQSLLTDITPVQLMKAIKNPTEVKGMRTAHIKDAVALCRYFSWLEKNVGNGQITEISGAKQLSEFRKDEKDFMGESFDTISSFGPHGAIIHYSADETTDVPITTNQLYLCDSGSQFKDGTTDVTRTFHFGSPTEYEKECYTLVLKGQLKLGRAVFPNKIKGNFLDSFAREYLWEFGLDYPHGTGHGVGHFLNVHEGPMGISWKPLPTDPDIERDMYPIYRVIHLSWNGVYLEYLWEFGLDYPHGTGHGVGHFLNVHEGPMGISWKPLPTDPDIERDMYPIYRVIHLSWNGVYLEYLWEFGLDYPHGTGHGVGHFLNVHEGPMGISWKPLPTDPGLEPNMFLSNEPGYYEDGKFGIRIEDIIQVVSAKPKHVGDKEFLKFETITLLPKSIKLINVEMLTDGEVDQLNRYHKKVRDVIGPILKSRGYVEAFDWLIKETEPIKK